MSFLLAFAMLGMLGICCLAPGFFFVRKLRLSCDEKLCASLALSIVLIYLFSGAIYLLNINWKWCWLITAIFMAMGALGAKDFWRFQKHKHVRHLLCGYGSLFLLGLLLLCVIRNYSGDNWTGDWFEHYQRALFFLFHLPSDTKFIGLYLLPTRPPLMNLVAAYFLAQIGTGYDQFQIVFLFLNLLVYFPCVLLAGLLVKYGNRKTWLIAAFLATSPMVLENATWTWTKELCVFYVILAIAFYIRGWRAGCSARIIAAAASMAAGLLVHYSAGPYAVALALHYLLTFPLRKKSLASSKLTEFFGSLSVAAALLSTWIIWSIFTYGAAATFGSNSTISDSQTLSGIENIFKVGGNLLNTLVPHPLIIPFATFKADYYQPNFYGYVRDYFFLMFQTNLLMSLGSIGWLAVIYLLARMLKELSLQRAIAWISFIALIIVLAVATYGLPQQYGVAHVTLQPLIFLCLTLLATQFTKLPRWLQNIFVLGIIVDVCLGIVLQFRLEMLLFPLQEINGIKFLPLSAGLMSIPAAMNDKARLSASLTFLGDHFVNARWEIFIAAILLLGDMILIILRAAQIRRSFALIPILIFFALAAGCIFNHIEDSDSLAALSINHLTTIDHPDSSQAYYAMGIAQYRLGELHAAQHSLAEAFLLDPFDLRTRYVLYLLCDTNAIPVQQEDFQYAEIFRANPTDPAAKINLATILYHHGHPLIARQLINDPSHAFKK
jgi:hypothetical protein